MPLLNQLARVCFGRRIDQEIGELAAPLSARVRARLPASVAHTPKAEARGYVRARTLAVVHGELEQVRREHPALARWIGAAELSERITERVVAILMDQLFPKRRLTAVVRRAA